MIYVISDLHGYPLQRFKELLESADFSQEDFLFILGDVIDRNGDGGVSMLLWLTEQPNIQLILGNHEVMLLSCDFIFEEVTEGLIRELDREKLELLSNYMWNGGDVTVRNLKSLSMSEGERRKYVGNT